MDRCSLDEEAHAVGKALGTEPIWRYVHLLVPYPSESSQLILLNPSNFFKMRRMKLYVLISTTPSPLISLLISTISLLISPTPLL